MEFQVEKIDNSFIIWFKNEPTLIESGITIQGAYNNLIELAKNTHQYLNQNWKNLTPIEQNNQIF